MVPVARRYECHLAPPASHPRVERLDLHALVESHQARRLALLDAWDAATAG